MNDFDDVFITTNQDYGSFYFGRLQHCQINPEEIAFELSINDQVRNERRQLPSIAYDIMFDVCVFLIFFKIFFFVYLETRFI
jgi:hypothetical protein